MKALPVILAVFVMLTILLLFLWIPAEKVNVTGEKPPTCDSVKFLDFVRPLNDSLTYRVKNDYAPNGTVYQNALVNFVWDYSTGGFIIFTCSRSAGSTCDLYKIEISNRGNFSSGRNVLSQFQMKESLLHTIGIEDDGKTFYLCDPQKRFLSRFQLIPVESFHSYDSNTEICSADYGNGFKGSARECDKNFLVKVLQKGEAFDLEEKVRLRLNSWNNGKHEKKESQVNPSGAKTFNKRMLFTSIGVVVMVVIAIALVVKKLTQWINKDPTVHPA